MIAVGFFQKSYHHNLREEMRLFGYMDLEEKFRKDHLIDQGFIQ